MYRFRNHRLIKLYSNGIQSLLRQNKYQRNVTICSLSYSTQSVDITKVVNNNKLSDNLREKRLQLLKRNNTSGEYDILSEAIIKSTTIEELMDLITSHVNVMNNRHLTDVFESLHDILRQNIHSSDCLKVLSSQQFLVLCNQTVKRMRFFQIREILTTLRCLISLNVSPNTTIIQSLLQMTRQLINDFSITQLIFLDFLLSKQLSDKREDLEENLETSSLEETRVTQKQVIPLLEALKLALPLVLELKIDSKELNWEDTDLICKCLRMASKHNLKDSVLNRLIGALNRDIQQLSVTQIYSVIASLISLPNITNEKNSVQIPADRLLKKCLDRVTESGVGLPTSVHHNFVVSLILSNKTRRNFYHKGLYEMVANFIVQNQNKVEDKQIMGVMWALTKQYHVHYGLLDIMAQKIALRDPDLIDSEKTSFTNILQGFALPSNYRPNESNDVIVYKNILESNHIKLSKQQKTKHLLFRILRHFSVLNYYPNDEIKDWITNHLEAALSTSGLMNLRLEFLENILILYQGLCLESDFTDCEDLKQILKPLVEELNAYQFKQWSDTSKSKTLEFALTQGLGGQQFIANNIFTNFGHFVDHLIVMRKGGYPVSISNDEKKPMYISQLEVPIDSKLIAIIPLTVRDYCREPFIKKGETDFRLRTLRKSGIITITVNLEDWEAMTEIEKIPFIMREIHSNVDSQQQFFN